MKQLSLIKISFASLAVAVLAFGLQSFTEENTDSTDVSYFYISNDMSPGAFAEPTNWSSTGTGSCAAGDDVPCELKVPSETTLEEHIENLSNSQILDLAHTVREVN